MFRYPRTIVLIGALIVLLLAACSGQAASTATPPLIEVSAEDDPEQVEDQAEPEDEQVKEEEAPATVEVEDGQEVEEVIAVTNSVVVENQSLSSDNTITISSVTADEVGWLVIHAQADGKPGAILGFSPVQAGENNDVVVEIDSSSATETLYAMLHVDADTEGMFDFPGGNDLPATDAAGNVVTPAFTVTGGLPTALSLNLSESEALGLYLTDVAGMSLYTFAADVPGTSNCYGGCAAAWPPLLVEAGTEYSAGEGIPGELGTTKRDDDTLQVTYNEWPLYYWINDAAPGDTNGHNVNNVWAVAYPTTHVFLGGNDDLGRFLVGPDGLTLYRFNPDEPGSSVCYDQCAANWPPLLIGEGEIPGGNAGVVGKLDTTERDDGTIQITYEGMPLYYWVNDAAPGDATGHGVNDIWYVLPPLTVRVGNSEELGDFLVGANGMTLYLFTVDEERLSNCYEQCAANWPPLLVQPGEAPVPGMGVTGELGVTERDDGSLQVIYDGKPLYYWVNDEAPGDTTGQGVNDVWFVVAP
jgi:predicted lipoprotein with Yx(FWY)xxD motif